MEMNKGTNAFIYLGTFSKTGLIQGIFNSFWGPSMAQSVGRLTLDFGSGHDLTVIGINPHVGLHAGHGDWLGFFLSFSPSLAGFLSLSLSQKRSL